MVQAPLPGGCLCDQLVCSLAFPANLQAFVACSAWEVLHAITAHYKAKLPTHEAATSWLGFLLSQGCSAQPRRTPWCTPAAGTASHGSTDTVSALHMNGGAALKLKPARTRGQASVAPAPCMVKRATGGSSDSHKRAQKRYRERQKVSKSPCVDAKALQDVSWAWPSVLSIGKPCTSVLVCFSMSLETPGWQSASWQPSSVGYCPMWESPRVAFYACMGQTSLSRGVAPAESPGDS